MFGDASGVGGGLLIAAAGLSMTLPLDFRATTEISGAGVSQGYHLAKQEVSETADYLTWPVD